MAAAGDNSNFPVLETLTLDDNKLTSPGVFQSLAGLPGLRVLDLNSNAVAFVPQLVPSAPEGVQVAVDPDQIRPFAALERLSLAKNKIRTAGDVITVTTWDRLETLVLWGNPIVTTRSTLPPELSEELRRRLEREQPGIFIARSEEEPDRPSAAVPDGAMSTVTQLVIPPIERGTSLRKYEADKAKRQYLEYTTTRPASTAGPIAPSPAQTPLPPITPLQAVPVDEEDEGPSGPSFFLTQDADSGIPVGGATVRQAAGQPDTGVTAALAGAVLPGVGDDPDGDGAQSEMQQWLNRTTEADDDLSGALSPEQRFEMSQRLGIVTPRASSPATEEEETFADRLAEAMPGPADMAVVPYVQEKYPEFGELFREDTEAEKALCKEVVLPKTIQASTKQLRFLLEHPLTIVFDRKGPGAGPSNRARSSKRKPDSWQTANLEEVLNGLAAQSGQLAIEGPSPVAEEEGPDAASPAPATGMDADHVASAGVP